MTVVPMLEVRGVGMTFPRMRGVMRVLVRTAIDQEVVALRGVDVNVGSGEVVGLVGPIGAGKTTLLKIVSTLLQPTTGYVIVDGHDPRHDARAVRDRIGLVLADDRALYWRLTGRENLEFFGVMHGLTTRDARARAGVLLDQVGLASRDKLVFGYSSGMRARLSLARALLTQPPLLLLDEPTRALDPVASAAVAEMLRQLAADGVAVFLSSHRLDEIETACDRIVVVTDGAVRFDGAVSELSGGGRFAGAVRELLEMQSASHGGEDESDVVADADVVDEGVVRDRGTW
jgi:ABC-2 type transport system ATP-binding protein